MPQRLPLRPRRAFTLVEILVAMVILLSGIVAIAKLAPMSLRQNQRTLDRGHAAFLAQAKAEEIRRDFAIGGGSSFIADIAALPAPTDPLDFGYNPRFAYQLSGNSLRDPADDPGTARVIVRYSTRFRPEGEILYELKFEQ